MVSCKRKLAGGDKDGKNVSLEKLKIKTNPDDATDNILKYKVRIIWSKMQFQIILFFSLP